MQILYVSYNKFYLFVLLAQTKKPTSSQVGFLLHIATYAVAIVTPNQRQYSMHQTNYRLHVFSYVIIHCHF